MKNTKYVTVVVFVLAMASAVASCSRETEAPTAGDDLATSPAQQAADAQAPSSFDSFPPPGTLATCPVMKDQFRVKADSQHSEYEGRTYVFCCPGCKPSFDEDPAKYTRS